MVATEDYSVITYEGDALLWQGSNRITGQTIRIDRRNNSLSAAGEVVTQLLDRSEKTKTRPVFTVVRAPQMSWDDKQRLAHYTGGATLTRAGMIVTAREIRAWMKAGDSDSSLDRAFADGTVKVLQAAPARTRTGKSDHAEYYPGEGGRTHYILDHGGTLPRRRRIEAAGEEQNFTTARINGCYSETEC
jgi:lipopolysaccharide export system protein LptA